MTKQEHIERILSGPSGRYYELRDNDNDEYTFVFTDPFTGEKTAYRCKSHIKGPKGKPAIQLLGVYEPC